MNNIDSREFLYNDNLYCHHKKRSKYFKTEPLMKFKPQKDESNAKILFNSLHNYLIGELSTTGQLIKNPIITGEYKKWNIYILVPDKLMGILKGENAAGQHGLEKEIGIIGQKLVNKYGNDYQFDVGIVSYDEIERLYKERTKREYKFSFNESTDESELVIAYLASPFFNIKSEVIRETSFNSAGKYKASFSLLDPLSQQYERRSFHLTDVDDLFRVGNNWFDDFWFPEYPYSFVFSIERDKLIIDYSTEIVRNQEKKKYNTRNSVDYYLTSKLSKNGWEITIYRSKEDEEEDFLLHMTIEKMSKRDVIKPENTPQKIKLDNSIQNKNSLKPDEDFNKTPVVKDFEPGATIRENQEEPIRYSTIEDTDDNPMETSVEQFDFQHTHRIFPILSEALAAKIGKTKEVIYFGGIGDVVESENDALMCLTIPQGSESMTIRTRINQTSQWGVDDRKFPLQSGKMDEIILKHKSFKLKIGDIFSNWNELHQLDNKLGLIIDTEPDTNNDYGYPFHLDQTNAIIGRKAECDINLYTSNNNSWDKIISSRYHAFLFYDEMDESYKIYNISESFNIYVFNENTPKKIEVIEPLDAQILKKTAKDGLLETNQLTNELEKARDKEALLKQLINVGNLFQCKRLYHLDRVIIGSSIFRFYHEKHVYDSKKVIRDEADFNLFIQNIHKQILNGMNSINEKIPGLHKIISSKRINNDIKCQEINKDMKDFEKILKVFQDAMAEIQAEIRKEILSRHLNAESREKELIKYEKNIQVKILQVEELIKKCKDNIIEFKKKESERDGNNKPKHEDPQTPTSIPPQDVEEKEELFPDLEMDIFASDKNKKSAKETEPIQMKKQEKTEGTETPDESSKTRETPKTDKKNDESVQTEQKQTEEFEDDTEPNEEDAPEEEMYEEDDSVAEDFSEDQNSIFFTLKESDNIESVTIKLGTNKTEKEEECWYFDKSPNRHCLITGSSGSGKTYFMQALLFEMLQNQIPSVIFDYSNSFTESQLKKTGFWDIVKEHIEIVYVNEKGININPFKPYYKTAGDENRYRKAENWEVATRIAGTMKKTYRFSGQQAKPIQEAIIQGLKKYRANFDFEKMKDLMEKLPRRYRASAESAMNHMSDLFYANPFKSESNPFSWADIVNSGNKITIIQLDGYPTNEVKQLIVELLLWDAWDFMSINGSEKTPLAIFLDEAQNINFHETSPAYKILTEGRKFGFCGIFAMQFTEGQLTGLHRSALYQSSLKVFFKPPQTIIKNLARLIDPTGDFVDSVTAKLNSLERGEAIIVKTEIQRRDFHYDVVTISSFEERVNPTAKNPDKTSEQANDKQSEMKPPEDKETQADIEKKKATQQEENSADKKKKVSHIDDYLNKR